MKVLSGISVVALLLAGAVTPSFATSLSPGGLVVPATTSATGVSAELASTGAVSFNFGGDTGVVQEVVFRGYTGNPFGSNDLTFVFAVQVTGGNIVNLTTEPYTLGGLLLDVLQFNGSIDGTIVAGTYTPAVSASWTSNESTVAFGFTPPNGLTSGMTSYALIINTNETLFAPGVFSLQDGQTQNFAGYVPAATPEPGSLALLGTGLLGVAGVARRRFFRR